ncbi:MAG: DUF952 domain-containing protein [bacterium]
MIYHIAQRKEWEDSLKNKWYETASLSSEGFIHCSPLEKLEESANNFFRGMNDLVLLCIDEDKVESFIAWEDLYNTNFDFPHIYGKLNLDAVMRVFEIKRNDHGIFTFPDS